jgi:hypothetical protein
VASDRQHAQQCTMKESAQERRPELQFPQECCQSDQVSWLPSHLPSQLTVEMSKVQRTSGGNGLAVGPEITQRFIYVPLPCAL